MTNDDDARTVLMALHSDGSTMTAAQVCERCDLPVGRIRSALGRLIADGYVKGTRHPQPGSTTGTCLFYGVIRLPDGSHSQQVTPALVDALEPYVSHDSLCRWELGLGECNCGVPRLMDQLRLLDGRLLERVREARADAAHRIKDVDDDRQWVLVHDTLSALLDDETADTANLGAPVNAWAKVTRKGDHFAVEWPSGGKTIGLDWEGVLDEIDLMRPAPPEGLCKAHCGEGCDGSYGEHCKALFDAVPVEPAGRQWRFVWPGGTRSSWREDAVPAVETRTVGPVGLGDAPEDVA